MKKLSIIKIAMLSALLLTVAACKNPVNDVKIVVDMNIMKYSALVHISGSDGAIPQGVTMTITGTSANDIYEISGKKDFTVKDGIITLGLNPSVTPTAGADVNFNVVINASGYQPYTQTVTFKNGVMQQVVNIYLAKTGSDAVIVTPPTPVPTTTTTILDFTGYCANRTNLQIRPSLYVYFREKDSGQPFAYLGYMQDGHIETNLLTTGKTYDFQITYAGENYTVSQQVTQTNYTETFNMGSSVCNTF